MPLTALTSCIVGAQGKHKGEASDFQPYLEIVVDEWDAYHKGDVEVVKDSNHR